MPGARRTPGRDKIRHQGPPVEFGGGHELGKRNRKKG